MLDKSADPKQSYYPFLDGFRAFAILWVMFHHMEHFFHSGTFLPAIVTRFCSLGFLGVNIFFVISGFLITGLLMGDLNTTIRLKRFYARRFFKIVPHYLLAVLVGLAIALIFNESMNGFRVMGYFFLYQNYVEPIKTMGHLWSIAVEEHFYLIYPLILQFVSYLEPEPKGRKKKLIFIFIVLIISGNILRHIRFVTTADTDLGLTMIRQVTQANFDALIFGCLLKLLENKILMMLPKANAFIPSLCFLTGFFLYTSFLYKFELLEWYSYTLSYLGTGLLLIAALGKFAPLIAITENPLIRWIGRNSYGIYLWHYILIFIFQKIYDHYGHSIFIILIYFISSILIGALTTSTVEKYFLDLRKRLAP